VRRESSSDIAPFKFTQEVTSSAFSKMLAARVDDYFRERALSRHANAAMIVKTTLAFVMWIASYVWLLMGHLTPLGIIGVFLVHGFAQLFMTFNVGHDANHGAYSKRKPVNRALSFVFDLCGGSSYMWRLMHNTSHHSFVNVRGADTTLISGDLFRFSPHDARRSFHRYQHLYAPFIYSLSTLDWVFTKDYRWLFHRSYGNKRIVRHPAGELVALFAGKAFYYTYMLVIPLLYLSAPWYAIVAGFTAMHLYCGFTLALIFQPNHFNEWAAFPEADQEGHIANDHIRHIFDTTLDYARGNPIATWFLGGLNLHIIHHMFPRICHVHYAPLSRIVKSTAEEFGLEYRETRTISGAFLDHLEWLRVLGNNGVLALAQGTEGGVTWRSRRDQEGVL
jgi:linoleoyl-CoA desaturase